MLITISALIFRYLLITAIKISFFFTLKVLADMKTGTIQFCLGGWLLFCPNTYLRSLLQTTDEKFWGNAHMFFSKDPMMPIWVHRRAGSNTSLHRNGGALLFPRSEACQPSQSPSASADLSSVVMNVTDEVSYMEISRMPLSCPFLPGHYRTGSGETKSQNFCSETVFAGQSRTHSGCYYVHKTWARSNLTKSQHGARREMEFSSGMWPLQGYPCSSRWSYTHAHTGNNKWTQSVLRERRTQT